MYHQLTRHLLSVLVDQLGSNVQLVGDPAQHLRHHHTRLVHNVRVGESEAQSRQTATEQLSFIGLAGLEYGPNIAIENINTSTSVDYINI